MVLVTVGSTVGTGTEVGTCVVSGGAVVTGAGGSVVVGAALLVGAWLLCSVEGGGVELSLLGGGVDSVWLVSVEGDDSTDGLGTSFSVLTQAGSVKATFGLPCSAAFMNAAHVWAG